MNSGKIRQRSDIIGTQVITRDRGKRLGIVSQLWIDVDRREVVALGLRDNLLVVAGMPRFMSLQEIRQMGDVILVDDEDALADDFDVEAYSKLTNSEVITETGQPLGKVRGFKFNADSGEVVSISIDSLGIPQVPDRVVSTYELSMDEIVSSGPDRLIVFEGAEDHLMQLTVGVLERIGVGMPPWEREELNDYISPAVSAENRLASGNPTRTKETREQPRTADAWDSDNWNEPEPEIVAPPPEPVYYEEEEEDNWSEATENKYVKRREPSPYPEEAYDKDREDVWAEEEEDAYSRPKVNIPEKAKEKTPEYEEEPGY